MRILFSALLPLLLILLCACERREPLARGQVLAIADMKIELLKKDWGTAREVIEPTDLNGDGVRYWTVRYPEGPGDALRVVFVNADTHWAQLREGEPLREEGSVVTERVGQRSQADQDLSTYTPGSHILILAQGDQKQLRDEARMLNALAEDTGLLPMFSVRSLPGGDFQLVYGWQGEHGTKKIEAIRDWVILRTEYDDCVWLDLLGLE